MRRGWTDWEGMEQRALFRWAWATRLPVLEEFDGQERLLSIGEVLTWTPNGVAKLLPQVAGKMKMQGLQSGFPDLTLPIPTVHYHGLYIELKAARPHHIAVTENQRRWLMRLQRQGYAAVVARGWLEASETITAYLKGQRCDS